VTSTPRQARLRRAWLVTLGILVAACGAIAVPRLLSGRAERHRDREVEGVTETLRRDAPSRDYGFRLVDATAEAGIEFIHAGGGPRASLLPEDMGSGAAWGDVDGDGDPDLYLVDQPSSWLDPAPGTGRNVLYRNDGDGRFTDISAASGADDPGFGMGAVFADLDGDEDLDLFVTNIGPDALYANDGTGRFTNVTARAGVAGDGFSAGAACADYDGDGDLDIVVPSYVQFRFDPDDRARTAEQYGQGIPFTLNPSAYAPASNRLWRNDGDGSFTDVAGELGVADATGRGMQIAFVDVDDDSDPDLYVANDITTNALFENRGGTFRDITGPSLAADYRGAMGLAIADPDRDLDLDIFITHWLAQENSLFQSQLHPTGRLIFTDAADLLGLGHVALQWVGWGTEFVDLDLDGRLDLVVINGSTLEDDRTPRRLVPQASALFWNAGEREGWFDIAAHVAPALAEPAVGRGLACADYDKDGDTDLLVTRNRGRALLLRNEVDPGRRSLAIVLDPPTPGVRVTVTAGGKEELRVVCAGLSYLSGHDPHPIFGLGGASEVERLAVRYPDGWSAEWRGVPAGRIVVSRGSPTWRALPP